MRIKIYKMVKGDKKKKLISLGEKTQKMLEEMSDLTGNSENQVIAMAIAVLYAQLLRK